MGDFVECHNDPLGGNVSAIVILFGFIVNKYIANEGDVAIRIYGINAPSTLPPWLAQFCEYSRL
jgi:hypothetical protein